MIKDFRACILTPVIDFFAANQPMWALGMSWHWVIVVPDILLLRTERKSHVHPRTGLGNEKKEPACGAAKKGRKTFVPIRTSTRVEEGEKRAERKRGGRKRGRGKNQKKVQWLHRN